MDLFFDTFEDSKKALSEGEKISVTTKTDKIYDLLKIVPSTHAPPICTIEWGGFSFTGVLDHVSGKFTLFLADGKPVRATLSVSFKEYIEVSVLVRERSRESADHRKTWVVRSGDRLDNIAGQEYGDPGMWRPIAEANDLDDPSRLTPGFVLLIPALN
jgi:nucleoid-associated protein YgaU